MSDSNAHTVVMVGTGATIGSGYTRCGGKLPGDRGFFGLFHLVGRKRNFKEFNEVFCCTKGDGQEGTVFANAVRFLPAEFFHLRDCGFDGFVSP